MRLEINALSVYAGKNRILKDVSIAVSRGERVALVGESGSGKSITCLSVMGLLPENLRAEGEVKLGDFNVLKAGKREINRFRWKEVSIIFQDPSSSLNPLIPVGKQVEEAIRAHESIDDREARKRVIELFSLAKVPEPEERYGSYPHQLSGGIKQRVMIAMALACNPSFVLADEPTTALDVTVQAQILDLLKVLTVEREVGFLLVTHDMGIVAEVSERVYVMYAGYIVEEGRTFDVFENPLHPYTDGIIKCSPKIDGGKKRHLFSIPGTVPDPSERLSGCPFHERCRFAHERCRSEVPELEAVGSGRKVRCFLYRT